MNLLDAIVAVARTSAGWEKFCQKQIETYASNANLSKLAEIYLYDLLIDAGCSEEGRVDYPWREHFIWHFAAAAKSGRCRVSGIIGWRREEIPADLFGPGRFAVDKLIAATSELEFNELILPDGTPVVAIEVEFPAQIESEPKQPPAKEARLRKRPGRKREKRDRVKELMMSEIKSQKTTPDSLHAMGWEERGARYKTSGQTAKRALDEAIKTLENS